MHVFEERVYPVAHWVQLKSDWILQLGIAGMTAQCLSVLM